VRETVAEHARALGVRMPLVLEGAGAPFVAGSEQP
jgi:hypothetical protein